MSDLKSIASRPKVRKFAIATVAAVAITGIIGLLVPPRILRPFLIQKLSGMLHHQVLIDRVRVNPYLLTLEIRGLTVKDKTAAGTLFSADLVHLDLEAVSIDKKALVLSELRLEKPYLNIVVTKTRETNISDILVRDIPKIVADLKLCKFSVNNIQVLQGSVDYKDGPKNAKHHIRNVTLTIPFISNLPYYAETAVQPVFKATINGEPVSLKGATKLFSESLETNLDLKFSGVDIPTYLGYVPFPLDFRIPSGTVDMDVKVAYTQYRDRPPTFSVTGNVGVSNLRALDLQGASLLHLGRLAVAISSSDLFSGSVHLSAVTIQAPEVALTRNPDGEVNIGYLMGTARTSDPHSDGGRNEKTFKLEVDRISVKDGRVLLADLFQKRSFSTVIQNLQATVEHLSTEPQKEARATLSFQTESEERGTVEGVFSLFPIGVEGRFELRQLALSKYVAYAYDQIGLSVPEGRLDITSRYRVKESAKGFEASLSDLNAEVVGLKVQPMDGGSDILNVPQLSARAGSLDFQTRNVAVGEFLSRDGSVLIERTKDGKVSLQELLVVRSLSAGGKEAKPAKPPTSWTLTVGSVDFHEYTVKVVDAAPSDPAVLLIDRLRLRGENITNKQREKGKLSLDGRVNGTGMVSLDGNFGINPPFVNGTVSLKGIDVINFLPYVEGQLKNITLTDGNLSAKGRLSAASGETGLNASFSGEALMANFTAIDMTNAEDLLRWKSLFIGGIEYGTSPLRLAVREIALADFYSRFIINADGSLNVEEILSAPGAETVAKKASQIADLQQGISIERISLQGGTIDFSDFFIKPNYRVNLRDIGGRVSGLSSDENTAAEVELRGNVDSYAPVEIKGTMKLLRKDMLIDIKGNLSNIELSPVTPYSGKYLGYTIEKGKLSMKVQYKVVKNKLDAKNEIFIEQLTLGEQVDSASATKLPVKLGIALLKNRRGEITLDLPISGNIDAPEFNLGSVIAKILRNILVKAATSPFALLGAVFGKGGEQLSYIEFEYGSAAMNQQSAEKLETLVKALADRPGLDLEVSGHADRERDTEGLKQSLLQRRVRAQKLNEMTKGGKPLMSLEEVTVTSDEYPRYLKMAYGEEKFPKPRNFLGITKDLPVPEMEKLMVTNLEVTERDLKVLANDRARSVKDYVLKSTQVEPERVFLVEPKTLEPERRENLKNSRVDFRLK